MALSDTSSDIDDNGDDNVEENNAENNDDTDADDDVDEDILEALEDAIAEDATDGDEESTYDSEDGSGDEDDAESELIGALLGNSSEPPIPPSTDTLSAGYIATGDQELQTLPTDFTSSPPNVHSPTPEDIPPPKLRSPSPAFLRKTKLLADIPVPQSYTVEAVCALPHPAPTHSLASSLCMTHLLTGSEDGYIRDYDIFAGLNGKTFLTAPQRHHCGVVEGLLKYAPHKCWWENPVEMKREDSVEDPLLSPVYSLLMQSDAVWSLAGTHLGHINLFTVRHEPGRLCHVMQGHRGPVSAMSMQHDEQGFFSAGWDGAAIQWDLNTGQTVRNFTAHGSQLTAIAVKPLSPIYQVGSRSFAVNMDAMQTDSALLPSAEVRQNTQRTVETDSFSEVNQDMDTKSDGSYDPLFDDEPDIDGGPQIGSTHVGQAEKATPTTSDLSLPGTVLDSRIASRVPSSSISKNAPPALDPAAYASYSPDILMTASVDGQVIIWDQRVNTPGRGVGRLFMNDKTPPWCASACWSANGAQIYAGRRNGTIDVWDVRQFGSRGTPRHLKILRNPASSGVVSCLVAFPDGRHIASASIDNVRLWNVAEAGEQDGRKTKSGVQFKIIPGHHGGFISQMLIDPAARFLITASGNRGWHGESTRTVFVHDVKHIR